MAHGRNWQLAAGAISIAIPNKTMAGKPPAALVAATIARRRFYRWRSALILWQTRHPAMSLAEVKT